MRQLCQSCTQDRTLFLQQLVVLAKKQKECTQAWWEEDLAQEDRWQAEDLVFCAKLLALKLKQIQVLWE
ncbi:hypothetical protein Y1Q_0019677 [Alligator mississippiensis]|uniref:Uncharacterized protein n=1 Tax=Alligator mississippiensis TaxID=8496 RepID=A0A151PF57_ALLMI|nr:hypothetical protein Y1Q_0019677 [Alligator mississippiensis]